MMESSDYIKLLEILSTEIKSKNVEIEYLRDQVNKLNTYINELEQEQEEPQYKSLDDPYIPTNKTPPKSL